MKKHPLCFLAIIASALCCVCPTLVFSQKVQEIEMGGVMMSSNLDTGISLGLSMNYNYWVNPHVGFTIGGIMSHAKMDMGFDSPNDDKVSYYADTQIMNLNGVLGVKFSSPVFKRVGVMADLKFMFEPIPFNYIDIDKKTVDPTYEYPKEKSKNGFAFTHFNPSYAAELSLFHESKSMKRRGRISLGGGITNHNPYNTYYRSKVDGIHLKDHLKLRPDNVGLVLFLRLTGSI